MEIRGIARWIVTDLVDITREIGQGRNAGCLGFVNGDGIVDQITPVVKGGIAGMPLRQLFGHITDMTGKSLIEGMVLLPENAVLITTRPGKTGLITDVSGVDFFNMPVIAIGVKNDELAGIGIIYPKNEYFDLATESEEVDLKVLAAKTADEEREVLRASTELSLRFLDVSSPLEARDTEQTQQMSKAASKNNWSVPKINIGSISESFAEELVAKSLEVGQGREVAAIGIVEENGHITQQGEIVIGGIGYVPSRVLASSCVDITGKSLREIYSQEVPQNAVIVHTHPGGTGVMHMGDANAGPGSWGRPIIAIGHDNDGKLRGATVIENNNKVFELADEDEELNLRFFDAETPEEETEIRNRKFGIAQEYTNLCKTIEIRP